jgi:hypothetical protein
VRGLRLAGAGAAATFFLASPAPAQERLNRDRSGETEIRGELPPRTVTRTVDRAHAGLKDTEIVIGVVVDGRARAYPVNLMWSPEREVVNDVLGETPIAASW